MSNVISLEDRKYLIASECGIKTSEFIIYPHLPLGALTVLEGNPGEGKSRLITALLSAVTKGDGFPNMLKIKPGKVLYYSREDDVERTIIPNLIHAGANLTDVIIKTEHFTLDSKGLAELDGVIGFFNLRLVVLDPFDSFIPEGVNINANNQVRKSLDPLSDIAKRHNCAVVLVRHFNKQAGGSALYRGAGSMGIAGAARSVLQVWTKREDEKVRYLTHTKSNLAQRGKTLKFSISDTGIDWLGTTSERAEDLAAPEGGGYQGHGKSLNEAMDLLAEMLHDGPVEIKKIRTEANNRFISPGSLYRAVDAMNIEKTSQYSHVNMTKVFYWSLPKLDEK